MAILLAMALLFAQWAGLAHSIVHAGWESAPFASERADSSAAFGKGGKDLHHSCPAFDAATIAATIHSIPFILPILPGPRILALWIAFDSWRAPHHHHFLSRAPPLS